MAKTNLEIHKMDLSELLIKLGEQMKSPGKQAQVISALGEKKVLEIFSGVFAMAKTLGILVEEDASVEGRRAAVERAVRRGAGEGR